MPHEAEMRKGENVGAYVLAGCDHFFFPLFALSFFSQHGCVSVCKFVYVFWILSWFQTSDLLMWVAPLKHHKCLKKYIKCCQITVTLLHKLISLLYIIIKQHLIKFQDRWVIVHSYFTLHPKWVRCY